MMHNDMRKHARELKRLVLAVEHGRRSGAEMERLVKRTKPAFEALYHWYAHPDYELRHIGRGCLD
jgi:hypothetical protein